MASLRLHGNGWQARVRRQGHPDITKTLNSRADAERWARAMGVSGFLCVRRFQKMACE